MTLDELLVAEPAEESPKGTQTPTARRPWAKPWLVILTVVAVIAAGVAGIVIAMTKTVTVTVDGESRSVSTMASTVGGALESADLTIGEHDTLAPAAEQEISDGGTIVVNRGRQFTLTLDGEPVTIWTTARTVEQALAELGRNPADYQLSADRSRDIPLEGLAITAATTYEVTLVQPELTKLVTVTATTVGDLLAAQNIVLAKDQVVDPAVDTPIRSDLPVVITTLPTVTVTVGTLPPVAIISAAPSVNQFLADAGVMIGAQDIISVPLDSPLSQGLQIVVTRIETTQVSETVPVAQPADETIEDAGLAQGKTKVTQQGQAGEAVVVYDVVTTNGVESSRTEVSRTVTVAALPTITAIGTKVVAATPAAGSGSTTPADTTGAGSTDPVTPPPASGGGGVEWVGNQVFFNDFEYGVNWDGLAKCESTNNPRAINPSGKYTGLFQFDDRTWASVGGSGRAYDASPEEQLMRAKLLYLSRGLQPWACAWAA